MITLESIRLETAFHEAAHAVIVNLCGGACDLELIKSYAENGEHIGWHGKIEILNSTPMLESRRLEIQLAGFVAEHLMEDLNCSVYQVLDLWEDGIVVPSSTDEKGIPIKRLERKVIVKQVKECLVENWNAVTAIVEELETKDCITSSRVHELCYMQRQLGR